MHRNAAYRLALALLLAGMLTLVLHPIHATPTGLAHETPMDGESPLRLGAISQTPEWNQTYGGTNWDEACSVVQTGDGGYAMAGYTYSFGAGNYDFWLVKTNASGYALWNQTYGGTDWDGAHSVVQTGDGGYAIAGETRSFGAGYEDFWLVKTDSAGNALWNQTYGGTDSEYAYSVVETADGGYIIAGRTESFGAGNSDFWLVKTDSAGNALWNQTYGGTYSDVAYSVVPTGDGGYAMAGYTRSFGAGGSDFWLVKTDADGNMEWNQTYGGTDSDGAQSVVETSDGGYALAGETWSFGAGGWDFWLVKTDSAGSVEWNQTYGEGDNDEAYSVVETGDGGYALAGWTYSFGAGGQDFWLVKTDAAGNALWNQTYGGTNADWAQSVVETRDGGYALAGRTNSFGAGNYDFWLVKTEGEPEATRVFFNVNPNPASVGDTLTLKGILVDELSQPLSNETVKLYARPIAGSWSYVTSVTTSSYGIFMWRVTIPEVPSGAYIFAVYYPGSEGYESSYNFATLIIHPTTATRTIETHITTESLPRLGSTNPTPEWNQTYGGTNDDRAYSVIETVDGGYAITGETSSFGAGGPDCWLVKTEGPEPEGTRVFFNVNPNPASVGDTITLRGILVDASFQPLSNETVRLYARSLAGSWKYVTSSTTSEYGIFTWQVKIPEVPKGAYILAVYYPGSEAYEPSYNFAILIIQ